jgi:PleD family two-component response regulator
MPETSLNTPRARLLCVSPEGGEAPDLAPVFRAAGYEFVSLESGVGGRIDLALVDLRSRDAPTRAVKDLANAVRRASPECGVVFLGSPSLSAPDRAHLRRHGELAIVGPGDGTLALSVCRQRLRLRNLAEEAGERLKTLAGFARLSEFPPIGAANRSPCVLIAGAAGPETLVALRAAEGVGEALAAFSAAQAMRGLESGMFDAAIFLPSTESDPLMALARSLRRSRARSIPLVVIPPSGERGRFADAGEVMPAQHAGEDIAARLLVLSRRARLADSLRAFLRACAGEGVRDPISGGFTAQFFAAHARRILARAYQTGRPAAMVGLRLTSVGEEAVRRRNPLGEAARLIGLVTRAEDCAARLSSDTFAVLMSATTEADAMRAARRIEGVIANTLFRAKGSRAPAAVFAKSAAVACADDAGLEESLAAVLARLNERPMRTSSN